MQANARGREHGDIAGLTKNLEQTNARTLLLTGQQVSKSRRASKLFGKRAVAGISFLWCCHLMVHLWPGLERLCAQTHLLQQAVPAGGLRCSGRGTGRFVDAAAQQHGAQRALLLATRRGHLAAQ